MTNDNLIEIIVQELIKANTIAKASADIKIDTPYAKKSQLIEENMAIKAEQQNIETPNAKHSPLDGSDALRHMQASTPARIGTGRCGPRLKTDILLKFREDHAAARDSVLRDVEPALLERLNLFSVQTLAKNMNEHLTRPDLGRGFDKATLELIKQKCMPNPQVQIYAGGGLSSDAVQANLENIMPAIVDGLSAKSIKVGTPFYVKFARVGSMDVISEILQAEVTCLLIGERPGLATAESMSAYMAYKATVGMQESRRTVVSNIHKGGIAAVEAGAYIADVIQTILKEKASGVELRR